MGAERRRPAIAIAVAAGLALVAFVALRGAGAGRPPPPEAPQTETEGATSGGAQGARPFVIALGGGASGAPLEEATPSGAPDVWAFGSEGRALGRGVDPDGNPIAPASFLAGANGELIVLDQENRRIVRSDGTSIPLPGARADDLARAHDGSLAVLDREGGKDVAVVDERGRVRGRLPLEGEGVEDARDISRVVVSGDDVYVERNGGGPLVRIGGIDGKPGAERTEVDGIPARDGTALVSAGITDEDEGRAWVTVAEPDGTHRWTRELTFPGELTAMGFVDAAGGGVWVVLLAGSTPAEYLNVAVCLDAQSGAVRARAALAVEDPPWASFRDFSVRDDGALVAAMRSDHGVSFATYACDGGG